MSPATQKALQIVNWEDQGVQLQNIPIPQPAEGEVLVKVTLRPINPTDIYEQTGVYKEVLPGLPLVNGSEGVGTIESEGHAKFKKGQRVVAAPWNHFQGAGTWQQYVPVPAASLVAVPDLVSDEQAAQVGMLDTYGKKGEWLMHTGANGSLGRMLIPVARRRGVKLINIVRRSAARQELADLKPDEVIVTEHEDLVKRTKDITGGKGVIAVLDGVGGDLAFDLVKALAPGGVLVPYGAVGGTTLKVPFLDLLVMNKTVKAFMIFGWLSSLSAEQREAKLQEAWELITSGTIVMQPGKHFQLEDWKAAVKHAQQPARGGKAMLEG